MQEDAEVLCSITMNYDRVRLV